MSETPVADSFVELLARDLFEDARDYRPEKLDRIARTIAERAATLSEGDRFRDVEVRAGEFAKEAFDCVEESFSDQDDDG
jgi:hypothetical protein